MSRPNKCSRHCANLSFETCDCQAFCLQISRRSVVLSSRKFINCLLLGLNNLFSVTLCQLKVILYVVWQVVVGGRNKYLINGCNATNTRVQDLFRSVQLNVNNPHFLIMQGRITKVLNMKPAEVCKLWFYGWQDWGLNIAFRPFYWT